MKKFLLTLTSLTLVISLTACGTTQETEKENSKENTKQEAETTTTEPQPNTSLMVDSLVRKGKDKVDTATEEDLTTAINYIKDNIDNLFANNEVMENTIYYGSLLEYYYAIDHDSYNGFNDIKGEIGMDAVQAVKGVYRNTETAQDQHVVENINQIKENLGKI